MIGAMAAIDVRGLKKSYGEVHALRGLDLTIERTGQIIGLLGPNGAGKTTFVEILEGLRTATAGTVSVLGLDPATAPGALRARLGVQLQTTAFMNELNVVETLKLYSALYPESGRLKSESGRLKAASIREGIEAALARVDLKDKARALVRTLSGGQRQRLALAMAMLHDPDLYILDEPTSGLDPIARRQIHEILLGLKRDGKTILLSSHYLDEIEMLADRVIILSAGQVVADGTPLELLARAAGTSTLWLEVTSPGRGPHDADFASWGADDPSRLMPQAIFEGRDGSMLRYRTSDPTAAIVGLADSLRASGARLNDLRLKRPSLEDVYLQLIEGGRS
jgi:ABC-2 type transport system ATP-binding protein